MRNIFILAVGLWLAPCVLGVEEITLIHKLTETATLPCHVPFGSTTSMVIWDKVVNGQRTTISTGIHVSRESSRMRVDKPAANEWNLVIEQINRNDEAVYTCRAVGGDGSINVVSIRRLKIKTKPEIIEHASTPRYITVPEGATVTMWCNTTGTPPPVVTWYRRSPTADGQGTLNNLRVTGHRLTVHNVTRYINNDVFECDATNELSYVTHEINMTVTFAPEVVVMDSELTVEMGAAVVMSCAAQGSPLYQVYWRDNRGTSIGKDKPWKYMLVEESDGGYPVIFLTLMIRQLEDRDYGTYTCHADGNDADAEGFVLVKRPVEADDEERVIRYDV